ncbi:GNAT family N-acetyltransferase [Cohnella xylanilytica]|uniref:GNAT family N-acetyltransferase n=1 Tax=Cohnella xylanilytica TaxID=557555 RepID=A0A841TZD7_9BACL|nr:GNAT family N-acetyltransferase [Cohnella xylanilytica]MBB6691271.1 GNAT family N-acetyltransferase [Cohnella xylanilytica]
MRIRQLTAEEYDERIALSEFAFQFKLPPERLEEDRRHFRPEEHWGAFDENGKLLSALILLPLHIYVQGRVLPMGGLAGVATWPEHRRGGNVTKLLVRSLEEMRAQGQSVSMLHPFAFPFYRKYGWEFTVERKRYEIETSILPRPDTGGRIERVAKDAEEFKEIYARFASGYVGMLARSEEWWRRKVESKSGTAALWRDAGGNPQGYILYEVQNRLLSVHDWAYAGEEARAGLWSFIANHDSMADRVHVTVPPDDGLPFLLPNPRFKQELVPYFMSRIVDVEGLIAQYSFREGDKEEELVLQVADSYAPWNDGRFRIVFGADGQGRIAAKTTREEPGGYGAGDRTEPDAACDIRALTAMLLGNRRPEWLRQAGLLQGSEEAVALLGRRIPSAVPYLADFF